jgi:hypothetical protein
VPVNVASTRRLLIPKPVIKTSWNRTYGRHLKARHNALLWRRRTVILSEAKDPLTQAGAADASLRSA